MKYRNCPAEPLGGGELLHFLQHFWIRGDWMREMLYFVQQKSAAPRKGACRYKGYQPGAAVDVAHQQIRF